MRKGLLPCFAMALLAGSVAASTPVGPGDVSGCWMMPGSPYRVQGDLRVPDCHTLTIDAGVEVLFEGPYSIYVDGALVAWGAEGDSVRFAPADRRSEWGHLEFDANSSDGSFLTYCVFERGNASQLQAPFRTNGGAIWTQTNFVLEISHCRISDCRAQHGGGLYIADQAIVDDCLIERCRAENINAGGGGVYASRDATLSGTDFIGNYSEFLGGGLYAVSLNGDVIGCRFVENYVERGHGGGMSVQGSMGEVRGCLFQGNDTDDESYSDGGAIQFWGCYSGSFHNNTLVDNHATHGSGIAYGNSAVTVDRCIIAFNDGEATWEIEGAPSTISYDRNCSYGNTVSDDLMGTATNTVNEHPLFCDYGGGYFWLCSDSPCLDEDIGAYPAGCGPCWPAAESSTWSKVKAIF